MLTRHPAKTTAAHRRGKIRKTAMTNAGSPRGRRAPQSRPVRRPLLELWLPADPQAVPAARHQANRVCRESGVSEDDCFSLDVALGEALANAVVHGAPFLEQDAGVEHICLCIWNFRDRLIMEVHDRGPGFEPPAPPYEMPSALAEDTHGRGLPLMQMLTDALIICRGDADEGGASIYLIKDIQK